MDRVFTMRLTGEFLRAIDDWRRKEPDIPSRAEAIRRLVFVGLRTEPILHELAEALRRIDDDIDPVDELIRALQDAEDYPMGKGVRG